MPQYIQGPNPNRPEDIGEAIGRFVPGLETGFRLRDLADSIEEKRTEHTLRAAEQDRKAQDWEADRQAQIAIQDKVAAIANIERDYGTAVAPVTEENLPLTDLATGEPIPQPPTVRTRTPEEIDAAQSQREQQVLETLGPGSTAVTRGGTTTRLPSGGEYLREQANIAAALALADSRQAAVAARTTEYASREEANAAAESDPTIISWTEGVGSNGRPTWRATHRGQVGESRDAERARWADMLAAYRQAAAATAASRAERDFNRQVGNTVRTYLEDIRLGRSPVLTAAQKEAIVKSNPQWARADDPTQLDLGKMIAEPDWGLGWGAAKDIEQRREIADYLEDRYGNDPYYADTLKVLRDPNYRLGESMIFQIGAWSRETQSYQDNLKRMRPYASAMMSAVGRINYPMSNSEADTMAQQFQTDRGTILAVNRIFMNSATADDIRKYNAWEQQYQYRLANPMTPQSRTAIANGITTARTIIGTRTEQKWTDDLRGPITEVNRQIKELVGVINNFPADSPQAQWWFAHRDLFNKMESVSDNPDSLADIRKAQEIYDALNAQFPNETAVGAPPRPIQVTVPVTVPRGAKIEEGGQPAGGTAPSVQGGAEQGPVITEMRGDRGGDINIRDAQGHPAARPAGTVIAEVYDEIKRFPGQSATFQRVKLSDGTEGYVAQQYIRQRRGGAAAPAGGRRPRTTSVEADANNIYGALSVGMQGE